MSGEREDRGEFDPVPVHRNPDGSFFVVLHAGPDLAALDAEAEKIAAELNARGIAIMKMQASEVDGLRIRSVPFDEFMQPDPPPAWPPLATEAQRQRRAQWKLEKDRYRRRGG